MQLKAIFVHCTLTVAQIFLWYSQPIRLCNSLSLIIKLNISRMKFGVFKMRSQSHFSQVLDIHIEKWFWSLALRMKFSTWSDIFNTLNMAWIVHRFFWPFCGLYFDLKEVKQAFFISVKDLLTISTDLTDVTLVSDDTDKGHYWCDWQVRIQMVTTMVAIMTIMTQKV